MKSIMNKVTFREIKHTLGRFTAILAIIALGVGFFSGVRVTTPAMVNMMNDFLKESNFYDYRLISTLGWDKDTPELLAAGNDVKYAEGSISLDVIYTESNGDEEVFKTHMLPEKINGIQLTEGRLPENADECIAEDNLKIGDVLRISEENKEETVNALACKEFTVVGIADSSLYINFERGTTSIGNGSIAGYLYLPKESFDTDYYSEIFICFNHDYEIYSEEYNDFIDYKSGDWDDIAKEYADKRYERLLNDANIKLSDGKKELEEKRSEGQKELDDAKKKLDDAEKELESAKKELDSSEKEIKDGQKKLDDAKSQIDSGRIELENAGRELGIAKAALDESEKKISDGESQLTDAQKQLDAASTELDFNQSKLEIQKNELDKQEKEFYAQYGEAIKIIDTLPPEQQELILGRLAMLDDGRQKISSAEKEIESGRIKLSEKQTVIDTKKSELAAGRLEYEEGLQKYEEGKNEYNYSLEKFKSGETEYNNSLKEFNEGKKKYEDGLAEYEKGKKEYQDGLAEYEDGKKEFDSKIADAENEIRDAENEIEDLTVPETFVLDRNTNIGYACFESDSEIVQQVARVFPIFFILVAALVCMTTMSRMVEEQRTQIGMFKALGYSEFSIIKKYMTYSGIASAIGCISGFIVGTILFPAIIWKTYTLMYIPLKIKYMFDFKMAAAAISVSLLCSIGTTWIACRYELSDTAANLMRPKSPKAGKRVFLEKIPFVWNKLKFLHKVSIRNIFRYKSRFFMMVIGVGGCMALVLTGFGLKDSIADFAEVQYEQVQTADAAVSYKKENLPEVRKLLEEKTDSYAMLNNSSWDLLYGNKVKSITLETMENFDNMSEFMHFNTIEGKPLDYPDVNEALISHSIAERYGAKLGKEIVLRDENMNELRLKVSGIFENHVYNYVFINKETYEKQLSTPAELNYAFINFKDNSGKSIAAAEISGDPNVTNITQFEEFKVRMKNMMNSLNYIVIVIIGCAAGLAFIVIYNLTNINITERTREIATIKVLGFFKKETSAYVFRENIVLTLIGIVAGIFLGILLHSFVMSQIIVDLIEFRIQILPESYLFSAVLTFVFNLIVNIFMEIKIEHIDMAASLKSVD